jgi:hypothetical protein
MIKRAMRLLGILCLLMAGMGIVAAASEPEAMAFGGGGQALGGRFVIADFDGDRKPDFATVNVDRTFIHLSNYSIHLQLSQGYDSAIGLTAPSGGLQLISRDVNGDDVLDLVVRTTLDSNLVAVLLNDGHGKFTLAKPGQFPWIENEPSSQFSSEVRHLSERMLALPSRNSFGDEAEPEFVGRLRPIAERLRTEKKQEFYSFVGHSDSGRAPPIRS